MLTTEQTVKLIKLVKDQPLLYANFNFNVEVDQQIEVLKLEIWENISKAMERESKCFCFTHFHSVIVWPGEAPQVIEDWNRIEERFNSELQTCKKATDFRSHCHQFEELQFLIRHYQQKNMVGTEIFEDIEYEFVVTEDDLNDEDPDDNDIFHELPDQKEEDKSISTFFECFNETDKDSSWTDCKNMEDASDEEFGKFLVKQLNAIDCEDEKKEMKRDILKMF